MPGGAEAHGERNVAIGGDLSNSIVNTGTLVVQQIALGTAAVTVDGTTAHVPFQAPRARHRLVGRDESFGLIRDSLLAGHDTALCGGLPGVGKTALAMHLAGDPALLERYRDGVLWAALGPNPPSILVKLGAWATAVGLPEERVGQYGDPEELGRDIEIEIGERRMLLVVDDAWEEELGLMLKVGGPNCVHLLTTRLADIAASFADDDPFTVRELNDADALTLLQRLAPRAVEREPELVGNCVRLMGGIPLAIILVGRYLKKVQNRPDRLLRKALTDLRDDAERRIRLSQPLAPDERPLGLAAGVTPSLAAAISASDSALSPGEREFLRALAVFPPKASTFSREAALAVAEGDASDELDGLWASGLVESISEAEARMRDQERYAMHQAIADYARMSETDPDAHRRMALYFAGYLADESRGGTGDEAFFDAIAEEEDNLAAALRWCVDSGDATTGLALTGALGDYWYGRSHFEDGLRWISEILSLDDSNKPELRAPRALTLNVAGNLAYSRSSFKESRGYHTQALDIRDELGDDHLVAGSLNNLGLLDRIAGEYASADRLFKRALSINVRVRNNFWLAINLNNLGVSAYEQGRFDAALEYQTGSLTSFEDQQRRWWVAMAQCDLAHVLRRTDDNEGARRHYLSSLETRDHLQDRRGVALVLSGTGELERAAGDRDHAKAHLLSSLAIFRELGDLRGAAVLLERVGAVLADGNELPAGEFAEWIGACDETRDSLGFVVPPIAHDERRRRLEAIRASLPGDEFDRSYSRGRDVSLFDVCDALSIRFNVDWRRVVRALLAEHALAGDRA